MDDTIIESQVTNPPLRLHITEQAFRPNPVTVRFSRAIDVESGDIVFDIGTGIGPLAIKAGLDGADHVYGVDPVALHCDLARMNVAEYGLQNRIDIHHGSFFDPFETEAKLRGVRANVIVGDVSGIADAVSHALGWYSDVVPTGGADGAEVLMELLRRAGHYLLPGGRLYFPVAVDLSDGKRIMEVARKHFRGIVNAFKKPFIQFPLSGEEVQAIAAAYQGRLPAFVNIQEGSRPYWRGQIWKATDPV